MDQVVVDHGIAGVDQRNGAATNIGKIAMESIALYVGISMIITQNAATITLAPYTAFIMRNIPGEDIVRYQRGSLFAEDCPTTEGFIVPESAIPDYSIAHRQRNGPAARTEIYANILRFVIPEQAMINNNFIKIEYPQCTTVVIR